jgi:hypothetical protein
LHENASRYRIFWAFLTAGFLLAVLQIVLAISSYRTVSQETIQQAIRDVDRANTALQTSLRPALGPTGEIDQEEGDATVILRDFLDEATWKNQILWARIVDQAGNTIAEVGAPEGTEFHWERVGADIELVRHANPILETTEEGVTIVEIYGLRKPPQTPPRGGGRGNRGPAAPGPGDIVAPLVLGGTAAPVRPPSPPGVFAGTKPPNALEIAIPLNRVSPLYASLRRSLTMGMFASGALMLSLVVIGVRLPGYLRGQRIEGQLELARRVQTDLLTPPRVVSPQIDFAVECIPAWEVGGDFCDVFGVGRDRVAFVLGDVSGKGISAALLMGLIHGAIHSLSWTDSASDHEKASRHLNELLCEKTARERFSSLFWAYFNTETSQLNYVNAGHLPPLLLRRHANGEFESQRLDTGGTVLGLIPETGYLQGSVAIAEGDLLVIFSDGIIEATNGAGDDFGEKRLFDTIRKSWDKSAEDIRNASFAGLKKFLNHNSPEDDQTLIIARFRPVSAKGRPTKRRAERMPSPTAG